MSASMPVGLRMCESLPRRLDSVMRYSRREAQTCHGMWGWMPSSGSSTYTHQSPTRRSFLDRSVRSLYASHHGGGLFMPCTRRPSGLPFANKKPFSIETASCQASSALLIFQSAPLSGIRFPVASVTEITLALLRTSLLIMPLQSPSPRCPGCPHSSPLPEGTQERSGAMERTLLPSSPWRPEAPLPSLQGGWKHGDESRS
jgi:hypothetical protein